MSLIDKRSERSKIKIDKRKKIIDKITKEDNVLSVAVQPPGVTTYNEEQNYNATYPTDQVPYGNSGSWINGY